MRFLNCILFILFNIYLIESANRTDSGGEISDSVREKSDNSEEVLYEEYDYDDGKRENSISEKVEKSTGNSTEAEDSRDSFPNEVFLSLRNITADAATAFRSFTHRNDVADLQASASDNLNVTTNATLGDAESAGINLRALRDAGHPPVVIEESLGAVHLPYKHAKIDTADLSDCALQGEWKPMGVAHGHLQVGGDHSQQSEILQSVGSYAVPNKVIPQWGQNQILGEQLIQDVGHNHKPFSGGGGHAFASGYGSGGFGGSGGHGYAGSNSGHTSGFGSGGGFGGSSSGHAYASGFGSGGGFGGNSGGHSYASGFGGSTGGHAYASGFSGNIKGSGGGFGGHGHGSGSGFGGSSGGHAHSHSSFGSGSGYTGNGGGGHAYASGYGGHIGIASNHQTIGFSGGHKIKPSMLSPPPVPPIIFGKKPGYWKIPKSKPKYVYNKNKRPSGSYGFSSYVNHAPIYGGVSNQGGSGYKGSLGGLGSSGISGYVNGGYGNAGGSGQMSGGYGSAGGSGYESGGHGSAGDSGSLGQIKYSYGGASGSLKHPGGGVSTLASGDYGGASTQVFSHGGATTGDLGHGGGGGGVGVLSLSGDHGAAVSLLGGQDDRPTVGHLIADHNSGAEGLTPGGHSESSGYAQGTTGDHLIAASTLGSADDLSAHLAQSGNGGTAHIVTLNNGGNGGSILPEAYVSSSTGSQIHDSTFSSTHLTQSGGSQFPGAGYLSSQNFAVHGQGILEDLSSSSTFTCGKNHDHNTNYHTATFQVADHDHPSSVDVLQYGGDAAVLIQSGDAPFHDQILPERKQYNSVHLSDAEASGSDNTNELASQAAHTSQTAEEDGGQTEGELTKTDDGEEPERHSYYHEITKVTKIPLTSVGSIQKFYSQYETKPQTFTTETETTQEEEAEQPQIIKELEHLSNKFQLDLENPQKLFEDPPNQELAYHYPFQGEQEGGKVEGVKEGGQEGVTEFPYKFYQTINQQPIVHHKRPPIKYIPRPGKVPYEKPINYIHPKPVVVVRKHKPKQFLKKQNYEVVEHGEKHRPIGEIFPPQKFPKQFHNPKPNFAVERPKKGWRPEYEEYKYDFSHGKKIRKFKTKAKVVAPIIIRRPVSPAPVLRVVQVSG